MYVGWTPHASTTLDRRMSIAIIIRLHARACRVGCSFAFVRKTRIIILNLNLFFVVVFVFVTSQLPQTGRASMSVVEVDEPQLVILLHFMTPFMAIQPVFESPLARPASLQGQLASQLLVDLLRDRPGSHGMLLVSIEQDGTVPTTIIIPLYFFLSFFLSFYDQSDEFKSESSVTRVSRRGVGCFYAN